MSATPDNPGDLGHRKYLLSIGMTRINDMLNVIGIQLDKFKVDK